MTQKEEREAAIAQWRTWVEQAIGGSPERMDVALRAAVYALDTGGSLDAITNAAQTAAAVWDSTHQPSAPTPARQQAGVRRQSAGSGRVVSLFIVVVLLSFVLWRLSGAHMGTMGDLVRFGIAALDIFVFIKLVQAFRTQ
jgi:hypothetical protein